MDETALIRRARQADLEAFNQLVLLHQDRVYRRAFWLLRDEAAADDITQETFLQAFRNLRSFQGGSFKAWLIRIATNAATDVLRQQKRHPQRSLTPGGLPGSAGPESNPWLVDPGLSVEAAVERGELRQTLQKLLDELPAFQRETVYLVDVLELDYEEAGRVLGVPTGTIKSRVASARLALRQKLERVPELVPGVGRRRVPPARSLCSPL